MQQMQGLNVSKSEFAAIAGVSPSRVSQWVRDGFPIDEAGRVSVESGKAWVAEHVDPRRRRLPGNGSVPASSRATRDAAEAEIARLKADRLAGRLIERDAVVRAIEARARFERDSWIGFVNRAAPEIAGAGGDLAAVIAVLDRIVRDQLAMLAATPVAGVDP